MPLEEATSGLDTFCFGTETEALRVPPQRLSLSMLSQKAFAFSNEGAAARERFEGLTERPLPCSALGRRRVVEGTKRIVGLVGARFSLDEACLGSVGTDSASEGLGPVLAGMKVAATEERIVTLGAAAAELLSDEAGLAWAAEEDVGRLGLAFKNDVVVTGMGLFSMVTSWWCWGGGRRMVPVVASGWASKIELHDDCDESLMLGWRLLSELELKGSLLREELAATGWVSTWSLSR